MSQNSASPDPGATPPRLPARRARPDVIRQRPWRSALLLGLFGAALATSAYAQDISINFGQGIGLTERALQLVALLTILSLAPSILVMVTSFTRIIVVLSLLRSAIGTQTAPPTP